MAELNQYRFKLYVSTVTEFGVWTWSDFTDTGKEIDIAIPFVDSSDFYDWFNENIGECKLQNLLTGSYTDEFNILNNVIPSTYYKLPGLKYPTEAISASGRGYQTFPGLTDITGLLSNYIFNPSGYLFAISSEDNSYYLVYQLAVQTGGYLAFTLAYPWLFSKSDTSVAATIMWPDYFQWDANIHDFRVNCMVKYGNNYMKYGVYSPIYEGSWLWIWGNAISKLDDTPSAFLTAFLEDTPHVTGSDPFLPGGQTDPGGGTGTFNDVTEPIDFPDLPTLSAVDTGFITLFNPSASELKSLANYMWGSLFDISTWKKIFADPMDAILGLSIVPVAVDDAGPATVTVGNISTGVTMNKAASQYKEVDCGSLDILEYWGAYLDYDPYTKAELYLPYCGTHPIAVDDIMGKTVHIKYHVDILSGSCCCYVKCGTSVLYTFAGQCSCSVPITGNDWTNVVNGALSIAASIGTMVATGGATAPMGAGAIASTAVNSMKPTVEKSGSLGGMAGMLAIQKPYLILTRPRQALPKDQNKFSGYPSFINKKLGSVTGYTEVESIHLEGIQATDSELAEIENLLKSGVIF